MRIFWLFIFIGVCAPLLSAWAVPQDVIYSITVTAPSEKRTIIKDFLKNYEAQHEGNIEWGTKLRGSPYFHFRLKNELIPELMDLLKNLGHVEADRIYYLSEDSKETTRFILWMREPEVDPVDFEVLISTSDLKKITNSIFQAFESPYRDEKARIITFSSMGAFLSQLEVLAQNDSVQIRKANSSWNRPQDVRVRWVLSKRDHPQRTNSCHINIEMIYPPHEAPQFDSSWGKTDRPLEHLYSTQKNFALPDPMITDFVLSSSNLKINPGEKGTCVHIPKSDEVLGSVQTALSPEAPPEVPIHYRQELQAFAGAGMSQTGMIPLGGLSLSFWRNQVLLKASHFSLSGSSGIDPAQLSDLAVGYLWNLSEADFQQGIMLSASLLDGQIGYQQFGMAGLELSYRTRLWNWANFFFDWIPIFRYPKFIEFKIEDHRLPLSDNVVVESGTVGKVQGYIVFNENWSLMGTFRYHRFDVNIQKPKKSLQSEIAAGGLGINYVF